MQHAVTSQVTNPFFQRNKPLFVSALTTCCDFRRLEANESRYHSTQSKRSRLLSEQYCTARRHGLQAHTILIASVGSASNARCCLSSRKLAMVFVKKHVPSISRYRYIRSEREADHRLILLAGNDHRIPSPEQSGSLALLQKVLPGFGDAMQSYEVVSDLPEMKYTHKRALRKHGWG